jgi:hypothetical protein
LLTKEVLMSDAMPLGTVLGFGLPPIGFIIAIIVFYIFSARED